MGKSAGKPPDYQGAAEKQFQETTAANRPNVSTGFASTTWGPNGMSAQLSPELQAAMHDMAAQLRGGAGGGAAADGAYNQATSRLDPQWSQRQTDFDAKMAAQGIAPGSEAYGIQAGQFGRDRNDAYAGARNDAFGQGLNAFSTNMQGLGGLYSFLQGPNFVGTGGPNYLGAAQSLGNFKLGDASQINQVTGAGFQALGNLGAAGVQAGMGGGGGGGGGGGYSYRYDPRYDPNNGGNGSSIV